MYYFTLSNNNPHCHLTVLQWWKFVPGSIIPLQYSGLHETVRHASKHKQQNNIQMPITAINKNNQLYTHTVAFSRFLHGTQHYTHRISIHMLTHSLTQTFIRLWEVENCTLQHHSPIRILPRNHTNIKIHAYTTPTHLSPTWTCTLMMVRGFSQYFSSTLPAALSFICKNLVARK